MKTLNVNLQNLIKSQALQDLLVQFQNDVSNIRALAQFISNTDLNSVNKFLSRSSNTITKYDLDIALNDDAQTSNSRLFTDLRAGFWESVIELAELNFCEHVCKRLSGTSRSKHYDAVTIENVEKFFLKANDAQNSADALNAFLSNEAIVFDGKNIRLKHPSYMLNIKALDELFKIFHQAAASYFVYDVEQNLKMSEDGDYNNITKAYSEGSKYKSNYFEATFLKSGEVKVNLGVGKLIYQFLKQA